MKILNTEEILANTYITIKAAKSYLLIISPYLNLNNKIESLLTEASDRDVKIIIICGKRMLKRKQLNKIKKLNNCELFFNYKLHAKCVLNEQYAILSSMNLYEKSESNYELGCLVSRDYDKEGFKRLELECHTILINSAAYCEGLYKDASNQSEQNIFLEEEQLLIKFQDFDGRDKKTTINLVNSLYERYINLPALLKNEESS